MLTSYITIALRNFWRDRKYALVNLIGLAVGFACVLMIVAYIRFELSYDTTYSNADHVYRIVGVKEVGNTKTESVGVPEPMGKTLSAEYPEVSSFTSLNKGVLEVAGKNDEPVTLQAVITDSNFFKVFNLRLLFGNTASVFKTKNVVVISASASQKLFPGKNPVGLSLTDIAKQVYIVVGVVKDIPANLHFSADVIFPTDITNETLSYSAWRNSRQYILLRKDASVTQLQSKLKPFYDKYNFGTDKTLRFQPVQSIHLHSNIPDEQFANSDIRYVYIFSAIALLILFIACINYINLTTARSLQRTKEVGVRKVMGAGKGQLAWQFLTESFLFFVITLPVSSLLATLCFPYFTQLLNVPLNTVGLLSAQTIGIVLLISILAGAASGLYPALFLSRLQPAKVLKGWKSPLNLGLRKGLIVFQFSISIILIIATIVIQMQLNFINNLNLGFNREHLIVLPNAYIDQTESGLKAFKETLLSYKNITNVSRGSVNIGDGYGSGTSSMTTPGDNTKEWNFAFIDADFDFIKTMQIPILEGRNFSTKYAADRGDLLNKMYDSIQKKNGKVSSDEETGLQSLRSMIITSKTAELINLKQPYAGQIIKLGALQGTIIGVIDDFKGLSLKQKNPAIVLRAYPTGGGNTFIRIRPDHIQQTIAYIQKVWKQFVPGQSFQFSFVDEQVQRLYDSEQRLAKFFGIFALLGIGIACLGLFSLVALIVQQRTKEIGIRKVLGAGVSNIVQLLSSDFIKLLIVSIVIASPIAWWAMNKWLQDYESRIEISWWMFAVAGVSAIVIALATVSFQAIRAALMNPVKSLRTE